MNKRPLLLANLASRISPQVPKRFRATCSNYLVFFIIPLGVLVLTAVFWARAQTIIGPGGASSAPAELTKDVSEWSINDPVSYSAAVEKLKTAEQIQQEAQ